MSDKVYFIDTNGDDFLIRVYESGKLIVDSRDDYYKLEGYKSCLSDLGFRYGGDFFNDPIYKTSSAFYDT